MSEEHFSDDTISDDDDIDLEDVAEEFDEGEGDEEAERGVFPIDDDEEQVVEEEEDDEDLDNLEEIDDDENIINVSDNHKFEIVSKDKMYERIESKKRIGNPMMTMFELTKIIGVRSQQIASGMAPLIEVDKDIRDTKFIAIKEIQLKKIPLIIRRYYPNNMYVDWRVEDLMLPKNILF
jgi:DNA-directed RNA polymerase I, II, and III subunit RPABC2